MLEGTTTLNNPPPVHGETDAKKEWCWKHRLGMAQRNGREEGMVLEAGDDDDDGRRQRQGMVLEDSCAASTERRLGKIVLVAVIGMVLEGV